MVNKIKNIVIVCSAALLVALFFVWNIASPDKDISDSERRKLASMPELSINTVVSGKFMNSFETYAADQFPMREQFRTVKSLSAFYVFNQKDVKGVYKYNGYLSKAEYPIKYDSLDNASEKFKVVYDNFLKDNNCNIYLSVIPDKNYFLAEEAGQLSVDYNEFTSYIKDKNSYMKYIDVTPLLELSDYYNTDTHWRQEKITDVAEKLLSEMGSYVKTDYTDNLLDNQFYGVYYGQASLPFDAEELHYLTNQTLDNAEVFDYENNKDISVYNMEKAYSRDPYEIYLSGSLSLIRITNPDNTSGKKLIVFRDSFGSSIAPLLIAGYSEIYLADIRYIPGIRLGNFIDFANSDVLFLYSALVLNNSIEFK